MVLTNEMLEIIQRSVLCRVATIDADDTPNVSPKEVFVAEDDALLTAHIASPITVRNLRANPKVCMSMVDVFDQRGFKFGWLFPDVDDGVRRAATLQTCVVTDK